MLISTKLSKPSILFPMKEVEGMGHYVKAYFCYLEIVLRFLVYFFMTNCQFCKLHFFIKYSIVSEHIYLRSDHYLQVVFSLLVVLFSILSHHKILFQIATLLALLPAIWWTFFLQLKHCVIYSQSFAKVFERTLNNETTKKLSRFRRAWPNVTYLS